MKIRKGFVSNSSTTSFCIYGISLDDFPLLQKACNIANIECDIEKAKTSIKYDICKQLAAKGGLEYHSGPEGDEMYFGISLASMQDDETFGNFKKRISEKLAEIFGEKMDCSVIEEAWRDG